MKPLNKVAIAVGAVLGSYGLILLIAYLDLPFPGRFQPASGDNPMHVIDTWKGMVVVDANPRIRRPPEPSHSPAP